MGEWREGERDLLEAIWDELCKSKWVGGMGFQDFEVFNLALLAKQGWHILQDPDSLVSHVLRDHPLCSFMDTELGVRVSYGWRFI